MAIRIYILVIILSENIQNAPAKRHRVAECQVSASAAYLSSRFSTILELPIKL